MGAVSGVVFMIVVPSPAPYLLASTFVSGLVFDLVLTAGLFSKSIRSVSKILLAAAISGSAESLTALSVLTYAGFFETKAFDVLFIAWFADVMLNIVLSVLGALVAVKFLSNRERTDFIRQ